MFPFVYVCVYVCVRMSCIIYVVIEEIHDKGGHAAVDANEEVDAGEHHIGCAGHAKDEGGRVHQGGDGPPAGYKEAPESTQDLSNDRFPTFFCHLRCNS